MAAGAAAAATAEAAAKRLTSRFGTGAARPPSCAFRFGMCVLKCGYPLAGLVARRVACIAASC